MKRKKPNDTNEESEMRESDSRKRCQRDNNKKRGGGGYVKKISSSYRSTHVVGVSQIYYDMPTTCGRHQYYMVRGRNLMSLVMS
ncbi:hypothetical protein EYF80_052636 [Liparis tanakae]|uniref:Uncharacterized protein n=1 Tax=Liparis tanakae TaxID=230148 RepID=A0A4Z2F7M1_9TELE|nr:hypothetical protein EYF80_052636 [Liparis tanakae]